MIKRIQNFSLVDYLEKHHCEIVGNGIFFHFKGSNDRKKVIQLAEILIPDHLSLKTLKMGDLPSEDVIIYFAEIKGAPKSFQKKERYLKKVFKTLLPPADLL